MKTLAVLVWVLAGAGGVAYYAQTRTISADHAIQSSTPVASKPLTIGSEPLPELNSVITSTPAARPSFAVFQVGLSKIATVRPPAPAAQYNVILSPTILYGAAGEPIYLGQVPAGAKLPYIIHPTLGQNPDHIVFFRSGIIRYEIIGGVQTPVYRWRAAFVIPPTCADYGGGYLEQSPTGAFSAVSFSNPGGFTRGWSMIVVDGP
jgi:hypothetical protein